MKGYAGRRQFPGIGGDMLETVFWDLYAQWYDRLSFIIPYEDLHTAIATRSLFLEKRDARVLDAGCGTGYLLVLLRSLHATWELTGIDRSPAMLRVAKRKLSKRNVTLLHHDFATTLPFPDASFDAVTSTNVLYTLGSPEAHLREIRRVLKPHGQFVLVNPWSPKPLNVLRDHFLSIAERRLVRKALETAWHMPTITTITLLNAVIAKKAKDRTYSFFQPEELRALLERNGFTVSSIHDDAYGGTCCFVRAHVA